MIVFLLAATAVATLILNLLLTRYLLKGKFIAHSSDVGSCEVMNFVLTPNVQNETALETEILETEIMPSARK